MAGYSGGLIALLASTAGLWTKVESTWHILFPTAAILALFFAAFFAVTSMTLKKTQWFSPNEWMKEECLTSCERLRRYHILTIWVPLNPSKHRTNRR